MEREGWSNSPLAANKIGKGVSVSMPYSASISLPISGLKIDIEPILVPVNFQFSGIDF